MTSNRQQAATPPLRPFHEISTAFRTEWRPGEAVLMAPEDRRPMPKDGVRVLLLGQSVPALMIHGFLFDDLPAVARLDPVADAQAALESLARRPDLYDMVLIVERTRGSDAIDFAEELHCRLADHRRCAPFVVALDKKLPPKLQARFRRSRACAASLLLPLSHAGFAALLHGLFHD
ncbi:MAG TPA: hypothetical protein VMM55_06880 [Thermohalobaculum sp.]|nr:hypothetical protein [Thermohalobaculum sp.]